MAFTARSVQQTIWAARWKAYLDTKTVWASLCNRYYEGDADGANSVNIQGLANHTIQTYFGTGSLVRSYVSSSQTTLNLNQEMYDSFLIPKVVEITTNTDIINGELERSTVAFANTVDDYVAGLSSSLSHTNQIYSQSAVPVTIGTKAQYEAGTATVTGSAYRIGAQLAEQVFRNNVPKDGRAFLVVPEWFVRLLAGDFNTNFTDINANGLVDGARVAGLQVYTSNNIQGGGYGTDDHIIAGHPDYWTFAGGLKDFHMFPATDEIGTQVNVIYKYGAVMTNASAFAFARVAKYSLA